MEQPVNVATPLVVAALVPPVQVRVPPDGFVPIVRPIVAVTPLVITWPAASAMPTFTSDPNGAPVPTDAGGPATKVSFDADPLATLNFWLVALARPVLAAVIAKPVPDVSILQ